MLHRWRFPRSKKFATQSSCRSFLGKPLRWPTFFMLSLAHLWTPGSCRCPRNSWDERAIGQLSTENGDRGNCFTVVVHDLPALRGADRPARDEPSPTQAVRANL